jgi:hypothetical protein
MRWIRSLAGLAHHKRSALPPPRARLAEQGQPRRWNKANVKI